MQDQLRRQVLYGEQQIQLLQSELDKEHSFQLRIQREKKENRKKFKCFLRATLLLVMVAALCCLFTQCFDMSDSTDYLRGITVILFGPVFIFAVLGMLFCLYKTIYYGRQFNGTRDPRHPCYKTYVEMQAESQSRMSYLDRKLTQTILELEIDKNVLEEQRQLEVQNDQKVISMEELYRLREEKDE